MKRLCFKAAFIRLPSAFHIADVEDSVNPWQWHSRLDFIISACMHGLCSGSAADFTTETSRQWIKKMGHTMPSTL